MKKILSICFLFTVLLTHTGCEASNKSSQSFTSYLRHLGDTQKDISNDVLNKVGVSDSESFSIRDMIKGWFSN